jgi:hypothetical protein
MRGIARRSRINRWFGSAAAGDLARPHIANTQPKTTGPYRGMDLRLPSLDAVGAIAGGCANHDIRA